jgi:hypothetical protein
MRAAYVKGGPAFKRDLGHLRLLSEGSEGLLQDGDFGARAALVGAGVLCPCSAPR